MTKKYFVVDSDCLPYLESEVTKYINEGWMLYEGLVIVIESESVIKYHQVVIKNDAKVMP